MGNAFYHSQWNEKSLQEREEQVSMAMKEMSFRPYFADASPRHFLAKALVPISTNTHISTYNINNLLSDDDIYCCKMGNMDPTEPLIKNVEGLSLQSDTEKQTMTDLQNESLLMDQQKRFKFMEKMIRVTDINRLPKGVFHIMLQMGSLYILPRFRTSVTDLAMTTEHHLYKDLPILLDVHHGSSTKPSDLFIYPIICDNRFYLYVMSTIVFTTAMFHTHFQRYRVWHPNMDPISIDDLVGYCSILTMGKAPKKTFI